MNKTLRKYTKDYLKENLLKCTKEQQNVFKLTYAMGKVDLTLNELVEEMQDCQLNTAMIQVQQTTIRNHKGE